MSTKFTYVVPLGYRCRPTLRLRDFYGHPTAFPFDWWNTPIEGLTRFLRDWDVDRLYDPRRLRVRWRPKDYPYIENTEYRFGLVHEFPREFGPMLTGRWRRALPEARARTAHLMEKFDKLAHPNRPALFVRNLAPGEEARPDAATALRQAVLDRLGLEDATFVLISRTGAQAQGWIALKIDDPSTEPWTGDAALWDAALATLGFGLNRGPKALTGA